jgi:hypothetical protein
MRWLLMRANPKSNITNDHLIFYHFRITMSRLLCRQSIRPVSIQTRADQVTTWLVLAIHSLIVVTGTCLVIDSIQVLYNPHKSPLCQFHDINLCAQANSITTSVQECQNNSKNVRRLRSSCQQNFGTHIFFNYLMDYYQNEQIVQSQKINLCKDKKDNEVLVRDELLRFKLEKL